MPAFPRSPKPEPFSPQSSAKASRLRGATVTESVCPYCAVGCGQLIYTKGGQLIDIEGNPESPINEGTLCPKGANAFQLAVNPHRVTNVLYRAPYSDHWETKSLDWALDQIAQRVKTVRDADFTERSARGHLLNSVRTIGTLGGATIDNEENYLIKKLFAGGLGVISIETRRGYDIAPRCPVWAPRSAAARPPTTSRISRTATASCSWAPTWRRPIRSDSAGR
jgi:formate dehydrogenase major subunit